MKKTRGILACIALSGSRIPAIGFATNVSSQCVSAAADMMVKRICFCVPNAFS